MKTQHFTPISNDRGRVDAIVYRTQHTYDQIASAFAAEYAAMPPNLALLADRLAQHVGPRGVIADIGCGHGRDTPISLGAVWRPQIGKYSRADTAKSALIPARIAR